MYIWMCFIFMYYYACTCIFMYYTHTHTHIYTHTHTQTQTQTDTHTHSLKLSFDISISKFLFFKYLFWFFLNSLIFLGILIIKWHISRESGFSVKRIMCTSTSRSGSDQEHELWVNRVNVDFMLIFRAFLPSSGSVLCSRQQMHLLSHRGWWETIERH